MARDLIIREHPPKIPVPTDERSYGCYDGWVYLGVESTDENGCFW